MTRLRLTDAADFPSISMRVSSASLSGTTLTLTLADAWPGAGDSLTSGEWMLYIGEYILPDTVAKVLSVTHETTPIRLVEVDPHASFDELIPRPSDTLDDNPVMVAVGGTATSTYVSTGSATVGLRVMVYPIPSATGVLHYSYKERLTRLSATTDNLYAPDEFCDDVVNVAEQKFNMTSRGNEPELAQIQGRYALDLARRKYVNSTLDPSRRHVVRPIDGRAARRDPTPRRDIGSL